MTQAFQIGDRVTWSSQSAGIRKEKTGIVIALVSPGQVPDGIRNPGLSRDHVSYLIRADGGRLYWPRVMHLRPGYPADSAVT